MQLSEDVRQKLATEFQFATRRMREEEDPIRKLYFFSAMFNEISRQLNWYWDQDLVLMHRVLQDVHSSLLGRIQQAGPVRREHPLVDALTEVAANLATYMTENDENMDMCELLARIAVVAYAATPHGTYITEKGLLKLSTST